MGQVRVFHENKRTSQMIWQKFFISGQCCQIIAPYCIHAIVNRYSQGGGGYSNFFRIRRFGPSIYRSPPKNIRNFKHPKKIFEILATPKKFCDDLKKYPQNLNTQKIFIFLKTPKNIEIQNRAYVCVKISEYPPPPPPPGWIFSYRFYSN